MERPGSRDYSHNRDGGPCDAFVRENRRQHSGCAFLGQPDCPPQQTSESSRLEVQQVQARVARRDVDHQRNRAARIREPDVVSELEQAEDRAPLLDGRELLERPGQVTTRADCRGTAGAVVPIARGVQLDPSPSPRKTDEEFLDQQAVIKNDILR